jgi:hypothetical protein
MFILLYSILQNEGAVAQWIRIRMIGLFITADWGQTMQTADG